MKWVKRYKLYRNGNYVGKCTAKQIEELCGINSKSVNTYAKVHRKYQGIYKFEPAEAVVMQIVPDFSKQEFAKQWTEMQLLFAGGGK